MADDPQAELEAAREERRALNEEHDTFVADMKERKITNKERLIAAEDAVLAAEREENPVDESLTQTVGG